MVQLSLLVSSLTPAHKADALLSELQAEKLTTAQDLLLSQAILSDTISEFKDEVLTFLASEGKAGDAAYKEAEAARGAANAGRRVLTTFPDVDNKLLDGGFKAGDIVELLDGSDAGATYICLSTTLNHLKHHATNFALWLDTAGTFSAEKAIQILRSLPRELEEQEISVEVAVSILDRLIVAHVTDLASAAQAIQKARRSDFDLDSEAKRQGDRESSTKTAVSALVVTDPDDFNVDAPSKKHTEATRNTAREQSIIAFMPASQISQPQSHSSILHVLGEQHKPAASAHAYKEEIPPIVTDVIDPDEAEEYYTGGSMSTNGAVNTTIPRLAIVVLDPITSLIKGILSGITAEGHARMTVFMRLLRSVANSGSIVLLTNTLTAASGSYGSATRPVQANPYTPFSNYTPALASRKASLGPTFTFLTDFTICMTSAEQYFDQAQRKSPKLGQVKSTVVVEVWRSRRTHAARWTAISIPIL